MRVLLVGSGGREHAIAEALYRSGCELYSCIFNTNPGIKKISKDVCLCKDSEIEKIVDYGVAKAVDFAIIGPEKPLAMGVVDDLEKKFISVVGPTKNASRIEWDKAFMRSLMEKYKIPGNVKSRILSTPTDLKEFIDELDCAVIKPAGLTAGKGVKIISEQLANSAEAYEYAKEILDGKVGSPNVVVVEEKLCGEEYTMQCFCDGKNLIPMPLVQDYKRAYDGDKGHNTGGMGSYSWQNHKLPFLTLNDYEKSLEILNKILYSLKLENAPYKGILYGQFILTDKGPKILEINSRFGDPEAMNVLPLLETNFSDICEKIITSNLTCNVKFKNLASVCRYIVPEGYGVTPKVNEMIDIQYEHINAKLYYASVNEKNEKIYTTTSRALALVGFEKNIIEANKIVEESLRYIKGNVYFRRDIGNYEYIMKKVDKMKKLRCM